jgi:hypothetical protein
LGTDRCGGITIQTNPTSAFGCRSASRSSTRAAPDDTTSYLVGQFPGLDPGAPPAFVHRGLASLGSLEFSVLSLGCYPVVSPASPLVIANGRYLTSAGTPIQGDSGGGLLDDVTVSLEASP